MPNMWASIPDECLCGLFLYLMFCHAFYAIFLNILLVLELLFSKLVVTRSRIRGHFPQTSDCELDIPADSVKSIPTNPSI